MLTLYQAEWCPYCHRVRQVLTELELTYTCVNVPLARADRAQVREVSGSRGGAGAQGRPQGRSSAPTRSSRTCAEPTRARRRRGDTPRSACFRVVLELDESPDEALALLRQAFAAADIRILSETAASSSAPTACPRATYWCRRPWSGVEQAVAIDPTVPAATSFSLAVFAVEGGSAIAVTRPFAEAWLYGEPALSTLTMAVTQRALRGARAALSATGADRAHAGRPAPVPSVGAR